MTMHKALRPRDDVDRLYVSRKEWERGLASIEDSVDASIQRLEDWLQPSERILTSRQITKLQEPRNKYRKKNNFMGVLNDK